MRILVLGGKGMAGHVISKYLTSNVTSNLYYSIREHSNCPSAITLDLTDEKLTYTYLKRLRPDIVINTSGILNEEATRRLKEAIYINSLLPHKLATYGNELGFQLIHISTDCVFSGLDGNYKEDGVKDGSSVYAITKSLGEVTDSNHITIRTSIIGPEIRKSGIGLFQWFMNQTGDIKGYQQVLWNGVSTIELAKAIAWVLQNKICGLVHLTGTRSISKYELLQLFKAAFNREDINIVPSMGAKSDKTLVNTREDFSFKVLDYEPMIIEMKDWIEKNHRLYSSYFNK